MLITRSIPYIFSFRWTPWLVYLLSYGGSNGDIFRPDDDVINDAISSYDTQV